MIRETATLSALRPLLIPFSGLYSLGVSLRNSRYEHRPGASRLAAIPVISIGNITVGGTGKTPIVMETVRRLQSLGRRPAVLTRGYAAPPGAEPDEVMELTETLPKIPVVVNPDRLTGVEQARTEHGADCVVLDDGFQHRRLRRDLDVVVIDALDPWGGGLVLPAGRLREPLSGLARADLFIISRSNQVAASVVEEIEAVLEKRAPHATVLRAAVEPQAVVFADERVEGAEVLAYHSVLPICGIGNPETFLRCVEGLAGRVCKALLFRDHQRYTARHLARITTAARKRGADLVVTTRKDWFKLAPLWRAGGSEATVDLARLDVRVALQDDRDALDEQLAASLTRRAGGP